MVSQGDIEEPSQPSDKANVPSTSQEPSSSSAGKEGISVVIDFLNKKNSLNQFKKELS